MNIHEGEIVALDITLDKAVEGNTAYYRLPQDLKEFLDLCHEKHGVIGFSWEPGSYNFGLILSKDKL